MRCRLAQGSMTLRSGASSASRLLSSTASAGYSTASSARSIPTTMRAAVVTKFGEPLSIKNAPVPTPGKGEVLIKVNHLNIVLLSTRIWKLTMSTII